MRGEKKGKKDQEWKTVEEREIGKSLGGRKPGQVRPRRPWVSFWSQSLAWSNYC